MKKVILFLISVLVGGACGFFGAMYVDKMGGAFTDVFILLLCFFVTAYVQIIIHEGGHLVFGLLTGYHFVSFRIGSFILYRQHGKFKFGKYSLAGTGGQCLMAPPNFTEDGKLPCILYNLGGIIMNGIAAFISLVILLVVKPKELGSCLCIGMIVIGILFVITNGLPIQLGEVDNDGRNALNMGKCQEALTSLWLQLKINECMTEGMRLRDMPSEWFEMPTEEEMANGMVASVGVFCCNRLMDEGKFAEAGKSIEELLHMKTGMIGIYKSLLTLDLVYCELMGERRPEIVSRLQENHMIQLMKAMKSYPAVLRTKYAYALLEKKDLQEAEKIKADFMKMKEKYPYPQEIEGELELINLCDTIEEK